MNLPPSSSNSTSNPFFSKPNIPNFITGGRIILFLLALLAMGYTSKTYEGWHGFFFALGAVIYLLDWLDGRVARKYGWQSKFGAIFDPAGDKMVAYSFIAYLYTLGIFPIWALAIILFRDVILSTMRLASLKYDFEFETSPMGKLRTNILGFGGAIIYALYYWGDLYFIEIKFGLSNAVLVVLLIFVTLNMFRFPKDFILRMYPRKVDKIGAWVTFIIAAVWPPYSIILSMVWITVFTLCDYGIAFKREVDKKKNEENLKKFLNTSVGYSLLGIILTGVVIGLLQIGLVYSILAATAVFISLVIGKLSLIRLKRVPKLKPQTQTTTSNSS
jgi:CDP-diacylglycerol--glycerol-3-phosphate 3-phosphatidyltransferase